MTQDEISERIKASQFYAAVMSDVAKKIRFNHSPGMPFQFLIADLHWEDPIDRSLETIDENETMFELFDAVCGNSVLPAARTTIIEAGNFSLPSIQLRLVQKYQDTIVRTAREQFHPVVQSYLALVA